MSLKPNPRASWLALLLAWWLPAALQARSAARVVAIGDVHGDFDALVEILQHAGLVDEYARWTGGAATLVQTGDFLDRGPRVREVMDLLMRLQQEAPRSSGRVLVLLGNHEAMNLLGVWRDVAPEAYAAFAEPGSSARRDQSWRTFVRWSAKNARRKREAPPVLGAVERAEFERRFPLGFFEYREALGPDGRYGRWLRTLPVIARQGDGVFLHGGISAAYAGWTVERINEAVRTEVASLDACQAQLIASDILHETLDLTDRTIEARAELAALQARLADTPRAHAGGLEHSIATLRRCTDYESWLLISTDGPLWFRGLARWTEEEGLRELPPLLAGLGASYFVAGHTPQSTGLIKRRFGGLAYLIDTGMLRSVYKGSPSALEIVGDRFFAVYPEAKEQIGGPEPLPSATSAAADASAAY